MKDRSAARTIAEAIAYDGPCSSCGERRYTIYFPIAQTKRAPFAFLCALCLAAIVDHALDFHWLRNLEVALASKRLGQELTPRRRALKEGQ